MNIQNKKLFREHCYINGKWTNALNKKKFAVKNPFDHKLIGYVPNCGTQETKHAIEAANKAWLSWRALTNKQRSDIMWKWAE